ncbi:hypothetical protein [Flavobacterium sp. C4GT6]|uniref:hypothetical protein n=1 Tax=Flavobacterium sp. C4GT6 TaxID=3103818 RepID=UPI002ED66502
MEKQYFKYDTGYVNIDSENLYLTNSGNWQEARELKEKSQKTKRQNSSRIAGNNLFLFIVFGGLTLGAFYMLNKAGDFNILDFSTVGSTVKRLGLLAAIGFVIYKYFAPELGKRYRIPLSKIESVEYWERGVRINFRNEANEPDRENIDYVETKGFDILKQRSLLE